jgi:hypothetical protein
MTIVEIKNQIIGHFYEHDSFNLESDGPKIELSDDLSPSRVEVLRAVLADLEALTMIKRVASGANEIWILAQSFGSFNQSVVISAPVGEAICDQINWFRDANDIGGDIPDKTKITEADILNLCNIIEVILQNGDEEFDDDEDGEDRSRIWLNTASVYSLGFIC